MAQNGLSPLAAGTVAVGTVVGAALIGGRSSPTPDHPRTRRWYRGLEKPGFTPPPPAYAVAWTGIQAGLAVGGYRLLRRSPSPRRTLALALWAVNQAAIAGWSEVFFGHRAPGAGTLVAGAMIGTSIGYVASAAREDEVAAAAGVPLVAWVSFATLLAEEIGGATTSPDPIHNGRGRSTSRQAALINLGSGAVLRGRADEGRGRPCRR